MSEGNLTLRAADLRAVLDAAARLGDVSDVKDETQFHEHAAAAFSPLVAGEFTACERYRFDPTAPPERFVQYQAGTVVEGLTQELYEAFKPHVHEHAFFSDLYRIQDAGVVTMEAFERRGRRFQRMGLYREFYRHLDITDQLSLGFKLGAQEAVLLTFSREGAYDAREAARLELLGPHLKGAWRTFTAMRAARECGGSPAHEATPSPELLMRRFGLSSRRGQVLALLCEGASNRAIAAALGVSMGTVRKHVELLLMDLGVSDRHEAARRARQGGER